VIEEPFFITRRKLCMLRATLFATADAEFEAKQKRTLWVTMGALKYPLC
jgi:hypothetical protein